MQRAVYKFAAWNSINCLWWGPIYLEDAKNLSVTAPSVFRNFSEGHSFSIKDKPGRFSAVGGDQKLEQTINLSSKCSDGVISHAKQKQIWTMGYHLPQDNVSWKCASWIRWCLWEDVWGLAPSQIISIHHRQKGRTYTSHHAIYWRARVAILNFVSTSPPLCNKRGHQEWSTQCLTERQEEIWDILIRKVHRQNLRDEWHYL